MIDPQTSEVRRSANSQRARARAVKVGRLCGKGRTYKAIAEELGISEATAENDQLRYPDEWRAGFAEGLADLETRHIPHAISTQIELLDQAEKDEVRAKVAADLRAEYGRGLDRLSKAEGVLVRIAEEDTAPRFDAAVAAMLALIPEELRDAVERAGRAAFAA